MHDGSSFANATSAAGILSASNYQVISMVKGAASSYARLNGVNVLTIPSAGAAQLAAVPFQIAANSFAAPMAANSVMEVWLPSEPSAGDLEIIERAGRVMSGLDLS
jgi:hypothetical protein